MLYLFCREIFRKKEQHKLKELGHRCQLWTVNFMSVKNISFYFLRGAAPILSFIRLKTYTGRLFIKGRLLSICIMLLPHLGGMAPWDSAVQ